MARAALYQLEGACWQIIIVVSLAIASLALSVYYGLQPEPAPDLPNLRAEACPRRTYKMAWFDEEFQTSRGDFTSAGLYEPVVGDEGAATWEDGCPSLTSAAPDEALTSPYQQDLIAIVKKQCDVSACPISALSQWWQ